MRRNAHVQLIGLCCAAFLATAFPKSVTGADRPATGSCSWGPVTDIGAVRTLLREWVVSTKLPAFDDTHWDGSIDHSSVWVKLRFAEGDLRVAWDLDDACEPTAITVEPSAAYTGIVPDEDAVRELVASFRTVTVEHRPQPQRQLAIDSDLQRATAYLPGLAVLCAILTMLTGVILVLRRRWEAAGEVLLTDIVRLLGLVAIVVFLPFDSSPSVQAPTAAWLHANALVLVGVLPLIVFLWLALSGVFSYGSPRREDWPVLLLFLVALAIRAGYARHANEELEIYFYYGAVPNRHSVVHPLYQMFFQSLSAYPYRFMMQVNAFLGALATLPLFLFVRQRTGSQMAAGFVAALYAVHPIIVQMTPTGGHYALVLSTWFAGLALLTADEIGPRQLFGGAVLLGIAATSRAEGSLYLVASLLLVDARALLAAAGRHKGTAMVSTCAILGLMAVHAYYCFPSLIAPGETLPSIGPVTPMKVLRAAWYSVDFNDPILVGLVGVGALAGLVSKRLRIGLGAAVATLIVVWPMSEHTTEGFTVLHRLVPTCALQVIAAGIGAAWITSWLPSRVRHHWAAAIPGLAVVLFLFVTHRHEMRSHNAVTEEFWMLRNHLTSNGKVNRDCALLFVGSSMDTDIHNFGHVLPGMKMVRCEQQDCVDLVSDGGCFYYLRNLNCFFSETEIPRDCFEHGKTPDAGYSRCLRPRCLDLERSLELSSLEEQTVDLYAAFRGDPRWPRWPKKVDIALYKVLGVRKPTSDPDVVDG